MNESVIHSDREGCSPETNLWLAVVQEVISSEHADAAERWLRSRDGRMVAAMAGLDTDWLADRIVPALSRAGGKHRYARKYFASARDRRPEAVQGSYSHLNW